MIKYSILIPNLGCASFLKDCFDSIKALKIEEDFTIETVCCDQSTGEDKEKVETLVSDNGELIKLIHSDIKSLYLARHTLMKAATGDYIVFLDSDDFVEDDYLIKVNDEIKNNNFPDMVSIGHKCVDSSGLKVLSIFENNKLSNDTFDSYFKYSSIVNNVWSKVFRKDLYNANDYANYPVLTLSEDKLFMFPIVEKTKTHVLSNITSYMYRANPTSLTHKINILEAVKATDFFDEYYKKCELTTLDKEILLESKISLYVSNFGNAIKHSSIKYKDYVMYSNQVLESIKILNIGGFTRLFSKNKKVVLFLLNRKMYRLLHFLLRIY